MTRMIGWLAALSICLCLEPAGAQQTTLSAGDSVRLTSHTARLHRAEGIVLTTSRDTIRVAMRAGGQVAIPPHLLAAVDVRRGHRASRLAVAGGVVGGFVIGGAIGGRAVHLVRNDDCACFDGLGAALVGVGVGGIVGAIGGGLLGKRVRVPRWISANVR